MNKEVCLSWSSHGKVLSDGIWNFFQESYKGDLDLSLSGHYLKVHHLILAIFCPCIKDFENDKFIKGEDLDINKGDLHNLVEFMYRGKVNVTQDRLPNLLRGAEALGFKALADVITKYLFVQNKGDLIRKPRKRAKEPDQSVSSNDTATAEKKQKLDSVENDDKDEEAYNQRATYRRSIDFNSFDPTSLQHVCKHCNEGFDLVDDYVNHVRLHENPELAHKCPHCNYKTKMKFSLEQHMVARHQVDTSGNKLERNLKCPKCSYMCYAQFQLKNHQYTTHAAKSLKCEHCPYTSIARANMEKHIKYVHLNERPFMCETCGSRFKRFQSFRNHLTTHIGKKRVCEICGASITVNSFKAHMKTHSEERPHPCHLCSFAARKRYNLKVHLKNVHKMSIEEVELSLNQEVITEENVENKVELHVAEHVPIMEVVADNYNYEVVTSDHILS